MGVDRRHPHPAEELDQSCFIVPGFVGQDLTWCREMVQESTGCSVRSVDRTQEPPGLREQFPNTDRLHVRVEVPTMDRPEMREIPQIIEFIRDDRESRDLLEIHPCVGAEVPGHDEILQFPTHGHLTLQNPSDVGETREIHRSGIPPLLPLQMSPDTE